MECFLFILFLQICLFINISESNLDYSREPDFYNMSRYVRKVGDHQGEFICQQNAVTVNLTNASKDQLLLARITDNPLPYYLRELSDDSHQLFQLIKDLSEDRIAIRTKNELVLTIDIGKKTKEFSISLENAEIKGEMVQNKKKIEELTQKLQEKEREAEFYKAQFVFLLDNLQFKPKSGQLEKLYEKKVTQGQSEQKQAIKLPKTLRKSQVSQKKQENTYFSKKYQKQEFKCPSMHILTRNISTFGYECDICDLKFKSNDVKWRCELCDFDTCRKCTTFPPQYRSYCSKNHAIKQLKSQCSVCHTKIEDGSILYGCGPCKKPICQKCFL